MTQIAHRPIGELVVNLDRRRVPVKASDRRGGPYPYYGASGVVDHVDDYLFEGLHLLVAEDGENLRSRNTPVAFLADGRFWVNNHAHVLQGNSENDTRYLSYALEAADISGYVTGSAQPKLSQAALAAIEVPAPPLDVQRAIAATLGALDDKIESNRRAAEALGTLIGALFTQTTSGPAISYAPLGEITSVVKGRSYKSAELEESSTALVTLKSIDRNGGYKGDGLKPYTGPYRAEQVVHPGEIVVAQTDLTQGAEVVGRGVRVPQSTKYDTLVASLDLAIVRPERGMPVEYLFGLLSSEAFRQHCRNHVTGTTVLHLAKDAIPTWEAPIVTVAEQVRFAKTARTLLARMDALFEENDRLVALRDSLLPELLSGRIRVPAEGVAA